MDVINDYIERTLPELVVAEKQNEEAGEEDVAFMCLKKEIAAYQKVRQHSRCIFTDVFLPSLQKGRLSSGVVETLMEDELYSKFTKCMLFLFETRVQLEKQPSSSSSIANQQISQTSSLTAAFERLQRHAHLKLVVEVIVAFLEAKGDDKPKSGGARDNNKLPCCGGCKVPLQKPLYCSVCKSEAYCSKPCQLSQWPIHKLSCKKRT